MRVPIDLYHEGVEFLLDEAELIDDKRFNEWLDVMTDDFTYKIPVRITLEKAAATEFSDRASHMDETKSSMEMRVLRAYSEYNWAEDPASRTRHFLTNFRGSMDSNLKNQIKFKTNFLLYRGKFDMPTNQFLSGERHDTIRKIDGEWKLSKRLILLDHATVPMANLAIFI
ncbi:aromatic-ring-hydroxylating dioxygenase subunit beta [Salipaludibacillus sp. CF4.18]|uniref:aromatic-ring-hydroxylating dioxygenase subunit beta n=1 Tax=Salipaludibacillus sp. CF4.18 TaxID=3373081 RepID=UPI003EE5C11E